MNNDNSFLKVKEKVNLYKLNNPNANIISLGVGDVSLPIVRPVIEAMHMAVDDLSSINTFKGYDTSFGYDFLKEKILSNDYPRMNFTNDEIYISCGTKTDITSILELFDINSKICLASVMYPVYQSGALSLNRNVTLLEVDEANHFIPNIPKEKYDIIYICSPNNPTGVCYSYAELEKWVKYAIDNQAVILYDNVYNAFVSSKNIPKSIYEIDGAKKVAIEFRSFSKAASFTGVRCSYYIIPNEISNNINRIWKKRLNNRFNGADYIAQVGAVATYSDNAKEAIKENIKYYKENIKLLYDFFSIHGYKVYGGTDAPFLWVKIKDEMTSWQLFDFLLKEFNIVVIPGIVFGMDGDKYFRVSGLASREVIIEAIKRMSESI